MRVAIACREAMTLVGRVISNKEMSKTAKVVVTRTFEHPKYKKPIHLRTKLLVHDEADQRLAGDVVKIQNCRPRSKHKRFEVIEVLQEAERYTHPVSGKVSTAYSDMQKGQPKLKASARRK